MIECEVCKKRFDEKDSSYCFLGDRKFCSLHCYTKKNIKHKFKAKSCEYDDIKFPSMLERDCYKMLKSLKEKGVIVFFLRQIGFDLPGGYVHKVDFAVFASNDVLFIEAKGKDLAMGAMKRKQVEEIYAIKIHLAKNCVDIIKILKKEGCYAA